MPTPNELDIAEDALSTHGFRNIERLAKGSAAFSNLLATDASGTKFAISVRGCGQVGDADGSLHLKGEKDTCESLAKMDETTFTARAAWSGPALLADGHLEDVGQE